MHQGFGDAKMSRAPGGRVPSGLCDLAGHPAPALCRGHPGSRLGGSACRVQGGRRSSLAAAAADLSRSSSAMRSISAA
nr:hypothetical protein MFLOJ_06390 [Mycobacterium florentinum]